jgi:hypothetical protein
MNETQQNQHHERERASDPSRKPIFVGHIANTTKPRVVFSVPPDSMALLFG